MTEHYTYAEIEDELVGLPRKVAYQQLLGTVEWKTFRTLINNRDFHTCTGCGNKKGSTIKTPLNQKELLEREAMIIAQAKREVLWHEDLFKDSNIELNVKPDPDKEYNKAIRKYRSMYPTYHSIAVILDVHHTYYVNETLPWEYPVKSLKTLCRTCHQVEHSINKTPVYDSFDLTNITHYRDNCLKCSGTGYLEEFKHVSRGICFDCGGTGGELVESIKSV